jgi:hypothetical protein
MCHGNVFYLATDMCPLFFKATHGLALSCVSAQEFLAGNAIISACLAGIGAKLTFCACAMLCSRRKRP